MTTEPDPQPGPEPVAACADCGLSYDDSGWADVVVPDILWAMISPTGGEGGLLCFTCMNRRLSGFRESNVPFQIASGPFAFRARDAKETDDG